MTYTSKLAVAAALFAALTACGGGGGGGGSSAPDNGTTNRAPIANAGASQSVDEQGTVTLDGSASSDPDGNALSYSWTQTGGVSVTLSNASSAQTTFEGPDVGVGSSTTLTFQLRVGDGTGAFNTATADVVVNGVTNTDPVVDAGDDQATTEQATVNLSGTASDSDIGDSLTFSWTELTDSGVTITGADTASASFVAPDVGAGSNTLTFQLSVDDGTMTTTDTVDVTVSEAAAVVNISGKVQYEFVPPNPQCFGLNFVATETRPIRAATVQLIEAATGSILGTTTASDSGDYSFSNVAGNLDVRIRVRAELKRSGSPSWDVEVRDNVDTSPSPPPLGNRPLYVVDFANFNTGGIDVTRDEVATTGWNLVTSSYSGARAAAPFAILDAIYAGIQLVLTADANAAFSPLDAFWSVNNTADYDGPVDFESGNVGTFYSPDIDSLFLLGDVDDDTDEFDDHVIAHEWGHYFEDVLSRSNSVGGSHSPGQSLDARLAFGEGWGYAISAMALNEPQSCDTTVPGTSGGFGFNVETDNFGPQGWFNEGSVFTLIYDLWDNDNDGPDNGSIGFAPIYETMTGPQRSTPALTTLFSFAAELRSMLNTSQRQFVDAQLARENIATTDIDIWGSDQGNIQTSPNQERDVLPLYTTLPIDGSVINICANSDYDSGRFGNKLAEYRYLRFTTSSTNSWEIVANANPIPPPTSDMPGPMDPPVRDRSDPDLYLYLDGSWLNFSNFGQPGSGTSGVADSETLNTNTLSPGTYVIALQEYRYQDEAGASSDFPEQVCFDVSMSP